MKKKVLIFPGSTEIGQEIWRSLRNNKEIELYSAADESSNHSPFIFKNSFVVPNIHDKDWIEKLNEILRNENIDYIFPAHDYVLIELLKNEKSIEAKIVSSPLKTCITTLSKRKTYELLKDLIPVPEIIPFEKVISFPVFIKPELGSGSKDAYKVEDKETLAKLIKEIELPLITEFLSGKEYTIDCFSDREHGLLFARGRERGRIKAGISVNSISVGEEENKILFDYAKAISKILKFHGCWFFQMKEDSTGSLKLLEIGARVAGTMATHRVIGVNFPLLSIYEQERRPITIMTNKINVELDRSFTNRYRHNLEYLTVYVDFDDTLIVDEKINLDLIRFLFQCLNQNKRIILITKHNGDIHEKLMKYRIDSLFDEIIHLSKEQIKSDFMERKNAIFIDDSFNERYIISKDLKIPTFDSSMIEMLMDERS